MSYILDALKKASAEREHQRGGMPDIRAQPVRSQDAENAYGEASKRPKLLLAAGTVMAVLAGLGWQQFGVRSESETQTLSTSALASVKTNSPVVASIAQTAAPTAPVTPRMQTALPDQTTLVAAENPAIQPTVTVTVKPTITSREVKPLATEGIAMVLPVMPPPLPATAAITNRAEPNRIEPKQILVTKVPTSGKSTLPMVPLPLAMPASDNIAKLQSLPTSAPKLLVSGSTFSSDPAHRMLILNGQVYREGDSLGSDLRLDQIRLKAAVVSYREQQYLLIY